MDASATQIPSRIIRIREVIAITGLSRSSIYLAIKQGTFPMQVKLSTRSSGWLHNEVIAWVAARPRAGQAIN
jgi:prophage regulatory protein